jgi:hypothetical protein
MTHSDRRHTRYVVPDGAFTHQEIKRNGLMGSLSGWGVCKLKDMSRAGMLLMTDKKLTIGDTILIKLTMKGGRALTFSGGVVNASSDHSTGKIKVGVSITNPPGESAEADFLAGLGDNFSPAP